MCESYEIAALNPRGGSLKTPCPGSQPPTRPPSAPKAQLLAQGCPGPGRSALASCMPKSG